MNIFRKNKFPTYDDFISAPVLMNQARHIQFCTKFTLSHGLILEFGVFQGKTINRIAKQYPKSMVYGFDSFQGLPESWNDVDGKELPEGAFTVDTPPKVRKNVRLVKGWFEHTLPSFLNDQPEPHVRLLHIDSDLYSSAWTILSNLNRRLIPGTIIIFDELANWHKESKYEDYESGEWKALKEWTEKYNREFTILARGKHCQASIIVR